MQFYLGWMDGWIDRWPFLLNCMHFVVSTCFSSSVTLAPHWFYIKFKTAVKHKPSVLKGWNVLVCERGAAVSLNVI